MTVQVDKAFEDGLLVEKTRDYYAQDKRGNVWYLGEDVTNYHYDDKGNVIGTDNASAWRAGRRGALPGWAMAAKQKIGRRYFQEFARRDEAMDIGQTHAVLPTLRVAGVAYRNVLRVLETNPFEPGAREFKYYAPRVGLIRIEEGLNRRLRNPELVFNLVKPKAKPSAVRPGGKADRQRAKARPAAKPAGAKVVSRSHGKQNTAHRGKRDASRSAKAGSGKGRSGS